jgi:hypothetical protein
VELEKNWGQFGKLGLGVAAVSYDSVDVLYNFAERRGVHFPLLSDVDSKIIRRLGIVNDSVPKEDPLFGISYACSFVLDANGVIVAKYFEGNHGHTYTFADILNRNFGDAFASQKTEVNRQHLKLVATASHSLISVGKRVALTLDIELKPNMHVYAPGVEGYIPISWNIKESAAIGALEVRYPAAEKLYLKAIDETVAAYRGHFQLRGVITIADDEKLRPLLDSTGSFTVETTLRYQTCDDQICYLPQEVPVKWTFQYAGFDQQRVPVGLRRKVREVND